MATGDKQHDPSVDRQPAALAKYILLFTVFGLFALTLVSTKYERRQTEIEQQFHGIQQMQKVAPGSAVGQGTPTLTPDQRPLIITLRPLMILLGLISLIAWAVVCLKRKPRSSSP